MAIAEDGEEDGSDRADAGSAPGERSTGTDGPATETGDRTTGADDPTAGGGTERSTGPDDRYTRKECVLITGCSSGIGRATALAFLANDWQVVATARNEADVADLAEAGCHTHELDVTDPDQVARTVEYAVEVGGAIDCLVNNAGYARMGPIEDVTMDDLHHQFDVNVYGPHRLSRAVLPHMRAQGSGRIVTISSVLGRIALPGTGAYSGTKFAVEAMSDSLRAEVSEFGIDVVVVEPGPVDTSFTDRAREELDGSARTPAYEDLYESIRELYQDAKLVGGDGPLAVEPGEVARAVVTGATVPEPPARYPVGPVAEYGIYARYLPDSLWDAAYGFLKRLS